MRRALSLGSGVIIMTLLGEVDSGEITLPPITKVVHHIYFHALEHKLSSLYFIHVFHWTLWIGIAGVILITLSMLVLNYFYQSSASSSYYIENVYEIFGFHLSSKRIDQRSMKIFKIIILTWMFLISSVFSSFLVAQLAVFEKQQPFNNLEELMNQNKYSLCMSKNSGTNDIIKTFKLYNTFKDGVYNGKNCQTLDFTNYVSQLGKVVCARSDVAFLLEPESLTNYIKANGYYIIFVFLF